MDLSRAVRKLASEIEEKLVKIKGETN